MPPDVAADKNGEEWHTAMFKMFFLDKKEEEDLPDPNVLMEVVSARGLTSIPGIDPSCLVRVGKKQVHRTDSIWNDPDPIWTVLSGSLCLLRIPEEEDENESEKGEKENEEDEENKSVCVEVCHGNQCVGIVTIPFKNVLQKTGEREEFPIQLKPGTKKKGEDTDADLGKLALRFRRASEEDLEFFKKDEDKATGQRAATDINFKKVRSAKSSLFSSRKNKEGVTEYQTQPGPDPGRVEETAWLSKVQLQEEALKPSTHWFEAGSGDMGKVYVEVIGCDDLVNLDIGVNDLTDAFAMIVMEDNVTRTTVVNDTLHPRFMPWSSRAFCFNVAHSSSLIFLGVFDYDALDHHDPVGRVVINTSKFRSNTSYLLHYPLHLDMHNKDECRGKIIIRLRVEWKNESLAVRKTSTVPPRFLINVEDEKSLELLRFMCRGAVNMDVASMESIKILAKELMEYGSSLCYVIDVMIGIFLWRGRAKFSLFGKVFKVWFPIHSVFIFVAATLAIEFPLAIPAIFFYSIAWALMSIGYYSSTHPNPWQRCRSMGELSVVRLLGRSVNDPVRIESNVGVEEEEALAKLDNVKADRVAAFLYDFMKVGLKVRRIYKKTDVTNIAISTEDGAGWSLFGNNLYYAHMGLYYMVTYLSVFRNFMNWRSFGAYFASTQFLTLGTIFLVFPMQYALLWSARIFVWIFLGPLMKVFDVLCIRPRYRNRDELEADPEFHKTNLESILTSDSLKAMIRSGRLAGEEALKLKHMRENQFGKFAQQIPAVDTQRKPCIPLPESTAEPYLGTKGDSGLGFVDTDKKVWHQVPGQNLTGSMIPHRSVDVSAEVDDEA